MKNTALSGKPYVGNPHVCFDEGEVTPAKPRRGSLLHSRVALICLIASLALAHTCVGEVHELIPKVWFDDAQLGFQRVTETELPPLAATERKPWLDPPVLIQFSDHSRDVRFASVGDWVVKGTARHLPVFSARALVGKDKEALFSKELFSEKARAIGLWTEKISGTLPKGRYVVRKMYFIQENGFPRLSREDPNQIDDSFAVVILLTSAAQRDHVEIVSKLYLNVDGRFICLGALDLVEGGIEQVSKLAVGYVSYLMRWEKAIRKTTLFHRLNEFGGDVVKMDAAIAQEISGSKQETDEEHNRKLRLVISAMEKCLEKNKESSRDHHYVNHAYYAGSGHGAIAKTFVLACDMLGIDGWEALAIILVVWVLLRIRKYCKS